MKAQRQSTNTNTKVVLFLNSPVQDYQSLITSVVAGLETIFLAPHRVGVEAIINILSKRPGIKAVPIVSHSSPGCLLSRLQLTEL